MLNSFGEYCVAPTVVLPSYGSSTRPVSPPPPPPAVAGPADVLGLIFASRVRVCSFIFALGVQLVGARMAEVIAEQFEGDFQAFWGALIRYYSRAIHVLRYHVYIWP